MTVQTSYPGVYIHELKSTNQTITGVSTSVTAFVGRARKGQADTPVRVSSFAEYRRIFGDVMDSDAPMGHAVSHFFGNGGSQAIIVRALGVNAERAKLELPPVGGLTLTLQARSYGAWANGFAAPPKTGLLVEVSEAKYYKGDRFDIKISLWTPGVGGTPATESARETWTELSMSPLNRRYVTSVLEASALVSAQVEGSAQTPTAGYSSGLVPDKVQVSRKVLRISVDHGPATDYVLFPKETDAKKEYTRENVRDEINTQTEPPWPVTASVDSGRLKLQSKTEGLNSSVVVDVIGVNDASADLLLGVARGGEEVSGSATCRPLSAPSGGWPACLGGGSDGDKVEAKFIASTDPGRGMQALDSLDFPRFNLLCLPGVTSADTAEVSAAQNYCRTQNAMLIVDPEPGSDAKRCKDLAQRLRAQGAHSALYWPRLVTADSGPKGFGASGAVAGVMARTDAARGVWKAPAGLEAGIAGAIALTCPTNDDVSGTLNPLGVNVLRTFPGVGMVVWGARTLAGSDILQSDHKYVPVRRLTDYISASLYLGTQFAVFEPNDPDLWARLRLAVGGFMRGLFRQGAFQQSEKHAESDSFFVTCDSTVNPQTEIDLGRVNVLVGFAPLKPAEFVIITITQLSQAGE